MNFVKKVVFSLLLFWICCFSAAQAQFIFHVEYDSLSPALPDSGVYGDTFNVGFRIYNNGLTNFNGPVTMQMRTGQGIFQLGDSATLSIPSQTSAVISAFDTLTFARYGGGVAIIVIWPTSPNFMNTDSLKDSIRILSMGIENGTEADFGVMIFPNPTADQLFFRGQSGIPVRETVLTNMAGQVILRRQGLPRELSLEDLPTGYYFLRLIAPSGAVATFKVSRR